MPLVYNDALASARLQRVIAFIDGGAGPGVLEIGTTLMTTVLAAITLADPSFGFGGDPRQIVLQGVPLSDLDAVATGVAEAARIKDSNGDVIIDGLTVGVSGSGANVELTNVNITQHQIVDLVSGVIIHP